MASEEEGGKEEGSLVSTLSLFPEYEAGEVVKLEQLIRKKRVKVDRQTGMMSGDVTGHHLTPSTWRHKDHPRVTVMRSTKTLVPRNRS